jgi:hypothetical protein
VCVCVCVCVHVCVYMHMYVYGVLLRDAAVAERTCSGALLQRSVVAALSCHIPELVSTHSLRLFLGLFLTHSLRLFIAGVLLRDAAPRCRAAGTSRSA